MMTSKGMVRVSGSTYRIVDRGDCHEVIRILDDRRVGSFRHGRRLEIINSEITRESLLEVATHALRSARLTWPPRKDSFRIRAGHTVAALLAFWRRRLGLVWLPSSSASTHDFRPRSAESERL